MQVGKRRTRKSAFVEPRSRCEKGITSLFEDHWFSHFAGGLLWSSSGADWRRLAISILIFRSVAGWSAPGRRLASACSAACFKSERRSALRRTWRRGRARCIARSLALGLPVGRVAGGEAGLDHGQPDGVERRMHRAARRWQVARCRTGMHGLPGERVTGRLLLGDRPLAREEPVRRKHGR